MTRTAPSTGPVIEARGLVKRFGTATAVDGISFAVRRGECVGLLGPNGAGKTTTIRMIYGFSPRTSGELSVLGFDVATHPAEVRSRLGVCQQASTLDPDFTVLQNLTVFARYFDLPRRAALERAGKLLSFMALDGRRDESVAVLSGGLARRLMIARALINEPELLILDEPTTGLDPQSRHQVWEKLDELKRDGLTVLLSTHYMDEAARLCDRLVLIDHGRILVEGKPRELVLSHAGTAVVEVPDPGDDLRAYVAASGLKFDDLGHRLVIYTGEGDEVHHEIVRRFCRSQCLLRQASLEDVFLRLTGRELRE